MEKKTNLRKAIEAIKDLKGALDDINSLVDSAEDMCESSKEGILRGNKYDDMFDQLDEIDSMCLDISGQLDSSREEFVKKLKEAGYDLYEGVRD